MDTPKTTPPSPAAITQFEQVLAAYLLISAYLLSAALIGLIRAARSWPELRDVLGGLVARRWGATER